MHNDRLSFKQDMVSVNINKPAEWLNTSGTLKNATKASSGSKTTFTNADLPYACHLLWNELYVPLLYDWAGTVPNPWICHDADIQGNLQSLWSVAYPSIQADIQPKQAIFVRVSVTFNSFGASGKWWTMMRSWCTAVRCGALP